MRHPDSSMRSRSAAFGTGQPRTLGKMSGRESSARFIIRFYLALEGHAPVTIAHTAA